MIAKSVPVYRTLTESAYEVYSVRPRRRPMKMQPKRITKLPKRFI